MNPSDLTLEMLAKSQLPALDPTQVPLQAIRQKQEQISLDWISNAAQRLQVAPPAVPPVFAIPPQIYTFGPFKMTVTASHLALSYNGVERFVFDQGTFGGAPSLDVVPGQDSYLVTIADAFYPGTTIPADLKARIWLDQGSGQNPTWMIRIRLKFGGFDATLPLAQWLSLTQPAASLVLPDLTCCPLGPSSALDAKGAGLAWFRPDWLLVVGGLDIFKLTGTPNTPNADLAAIFLVPKQVQYILPKALRRTGILLSAFERFPLQPEFSFALPGVDLGTFRFDAMAIEAGLDANDKAQRVLYTQSTTNLSGARLQIGGDLYDSDGEPFGVPLYNVKYAAAFNGARQRTVSALVSGVEDALFWMHSPGCSLLLGPPYGAGLFPGIAVGILDVPGQGPLILCQAGAHSSVLHLPDVFVEPTSIARKNAVFTWGPPAAPLGPAVIHVEVDTGAQVATIRIPPDPTTRIVRRDDLLVLDFRFHGLTFESKGPLRHLIPAGQEAPYVAIQFPPQSIGEEAFFEADLSYPVNQSDAPPPAGQDIPVVVPPRPPVRALPAKPSRLVFFLPDGTAEIPYSLATLLDWLPWTPSLAPTALPGQGRVRASGLDQVLRLASGPAETFLRPVSKAAAFRSVLRRMLPGRARFSSLLGELIDIVGPITVLTPQAPDQKTTAIEAPFRLIISPNKHGAWKHEMGPVAHGGRVELWHTRLGTRTGSGIDEGPNVQRTIRAIWSRDHDHPPPANQPNLPFLMPLDQDDRRQIVHITADFTKKSIAPVGVNRLMLSALGAWLDLHGRWTPVPEDELSLEEWLHRATMARDHYVRVVYKGFLFPFGHRASLVKITERKVQLDTDGLPGAYLRQRMYIIVREPEKEYTAAGYKNQGRETPLKRVHITTRVTPNLDPPQNSRLWPRPGESTPTPAFPPLAAFWPSVAGKRFFFHVQAYDWEGREADFVMPMAFVRSDQDMQVAREQYNLWDAGARSATLNGQRVAYAEAAGAQSGKTTLETESITLQVEPPFNAPVEPPCYPRLASAQVFLPALRQVAGNNASAQIAIDYYIEHGFGASANKAKLFAQVSNAPNLDYAQAGADKAGGVSTPNLVTRALTVELGAVGQDTPSFAQGNLNPQDFFKDSAAKILGGIDLFDIIAALTPSDFLSDAPQLVTTNTDDEIRTRLYWKTQKLKPAPDFRPIFYPALLDQTKAELSLESQFVTQKKNPTATEAQFQGALTSFRIDFFNAIIVQFEKLTFEAPKNKKPDVHVDVKDVTFAGPLEFVQKLRDNLHLDQFVDPPFLDVTAQGIQAGYTLSIPTVAVGVFALQNLALGARLMLPFTGEPVRLRFNISERHNPFLVSVSLFAGAGFFAIAVGADGIEVLEAAIEFGGNVSIDLGVASGGVYVMAGIYLKVKTVKVQGNDTEESELTGYVRAGGSLQVLGLVAISMEFYLGLTYSKPKAWGEAQVTVKVEVLMFSKSVTVTMRREFAGSSNLLTFGEMMPVEQWQTYCGAFAKGA